VSTVELDAELVTVVESNPLLDWTDTARSPPRRARWPAATN